MLIFIYFFCFPNKKAPQVLKIRVNVSIKGFILFIPLTLSPSFHCIKTFIIMDLTLTWCIRLNVPYKRVCLHVRAFVCVCVYFVCFVKRSICNLKQCVYACEFAFLCEHASVCVCFCARVRACMWTIWYVMPFVLCVFLCVGCAAHPFAVPVAGTAPGLDPYQHAPAQTEWVTNTLCSYSLSFHNTAYRVCKV